jgi:hypothetical protein
MEVENSEPTKEGDSKEEVMKDVEQDATSNE